MTATDLEMTAFERRLGAELRTMSAVALREMPASDLARGAILASGARRWPIGRRLRLVAVALVVVAFATAALLAFVGASRHGPLPRFRTGELAYVAVATLLDVNTGTLYLANADGSAPRRILDSVDATVDWSPTGRYFTVSRATPDGSAEILVMDADGGLHGTITERAYGSWDWTSHDELVVSSYDAVPSLRVYRVDGSLARTLVWPPGVARLQGWLISPDGRTMVVEGCERCKGNKYDDLPTLGWDLWRIDLEGGSAIRLSQSPEQMESVGSRWTDSATFDFTVFCWTGDIVGACPDGDATRWTMAIDGSGRHQVAPVSGDVSPDGSKVARMTPPDTMWRVHLVDTATGADVEVATGGGWDQPWGWSPGSDRLLVIEDQSDPATATNDVYSVWMVDADGTHARRLVDGWATAAWQPIPVDPWP